MGRLNSPVHVHADLNQKYEVEYPVRVNAEHVGHSTQSGPHTVCQIVKDVYVTLECKVWLQQLCLIK